MVDTRLLRNRTAGPHHSCGLCTTVESCTTHQLVSLTILIWRGHLERKAKASPLLLSQSAAHSGLFVRGGGFYCLSPLLRAGLQECEWSPAPRSNSANTTAARALGIRTFWPGAARPEIEYPQHDSLTAAVCKCKWLERCSSRDNAWLYFILTPRWNCTNSNSDIGPP